MRKVSSAGLRLALCAGLLVVPGLARAQAEDEGVGFERTPPRLSFLDGEVSFLRPGAEDWTPARVNLALAAGDELYTGESANLELQIGPRAFLRAGENTQLGLTSLEPDYLQLRLVQGNLSLDLRSLGSGHTLEVGTPNAAFTVERSGYYRVEVGDDTTTFTSRRGGRATLTPAASEPKEIAASEQVVVTGTDAPQLESYAAPELDAWDRWNYTRTDDQLDAVSARYVPPSVYGAYDLDHHGDWRIVSTYGPVWVPRHVGAGWAPYSTGRWIWDPWYGWTWLDDAPWGWAPFHYGRWVYLSGYWGWCPGPIVVRPYYAPALVAFYGGRGFTFGTPHVGWVALGWGEPLVPWWGPRHFREHGHWAGWGGPRIVNRSVVQHTGAYRAQQIQTYQNVDVRGAIVSVDRDHFGRRSVEPTRFERVEPSRMKPLRGELDVTPDRSSLVGEARAARRPPPQLRERAVVATRAPKLDPVAPLGPGAASRAAPARVVTPPRSERVQRVLERPPFAREGGLERRPPPPAPRFQRPAPLETRPPGPQRTQPAPGMPPSPQLERTRPERVELPQPRLGERGVTDLPGEPANRVYRGQHLGQPGAMPRAPAPEPRSLQPGRSPGAGQHGGGAGRGQPGGGFDPGQRGPGR